MISDFKFQDFLKSKVLIQLSGGKDSIACLALLKENHIKCSAIHFTHDYAYSIPTDEAKRICNYFNIDLHITDITKEIKQLLLNNKISRPCRQCKGIMDKITLEYAIKNRFNYICTGDSGDDTALISRLKKYNGRDLFIGNYFNNSVKLPPDINIIRPLITTSSTEIFDFLEKIGINVNRVGDTGDKYFEYSREGCPLQFKDFCADYSENLMQKLKKYNILCTEFAKSKGIRASIHLPSEFIITIPKGYELACYNYLKQNGCDLKGVNLSPHTGLLNKYLIQLSMPRDFFFDIRFRTAITRFFERINGSALDSEPEIFNNTFDFIGSNVSLNIRLFQKMEMIIGILSSKKSFAKDEIKNLVIEVFNTDKVIITEQAFDKKNIILFDNNFSGNHEFIKELNNEITVAFERLGYTVYHANSFKEGEEIHNLVKIDFSIELGKYSIFNDNKAFYDVYSIPHYQWIFDNPQKTIIDSNSKYIHYIFSDSEFHLTCKKLSNRPLHLPIGYLPQKIRNNQTPKRDAILFPCQIRDINNITQEISNSELADYVFDFVKSFDYDSSYIRQFNRYINIHKNEISNTNIFFRLTNSYLRIKKRLMVLENIRIKEIYVLGEKPMFEIGNNNNIHYLSEVPYREIFNLTSKFKYTINVDPNFFSTYHDRVLRAINAGGICITNENSLISPTTGYSACYRFSEIEKINDLLVYLDDNYEKIMNEQQKFITGLDWISSIKQLESKINFA